MNLPPLLIASIVFAAIYLSMVIYCLVGWLRLKKSSFQIPKSDSALPSVTIVIPVRNEAPYIKDCLEAVLKQNYPQHLMEVIVIDDYSLDPTLELAREFLPKPNLTVIDLSQYLGKTGEHFPNKKRCIALGIKNAKGELIVTLDGDCTMGENWLAAMVSYYREFNLKLLAGPVSIKPAKSPFAWFQLLDVMNLSAIGGAFIRNGLAAICNGANLMYAKETFTEVEGFKGSYDVAIGDDLFLMQKIDQRYGGSIGFVKNIEACVYTKSTGSLGDFISQRTRWISKLTDLSKWSVTLIALYNYFFHAAIIAAAAYAISSPATRWLSLAIMGGTKLFADLLFNIPVAIFFRSKLLLLLFPVINVFHLLYVIIIGVLSLRGRYTWKDRTVK